MKILMVNLSNFREEKEHPRHSLPYPSFLFSSFFLKKMGHVVRVIEILNRRLLKKFLSLSWEGYILIINSPVERMKIVEEIINDLRKKVKEIWLMGPITLLPKNFLFKDSPVKLLIQGEPEKTIIELIKCLENGKPIEKVGGIAYFNRKIIIKRRKSLINDLDGFPFLYKTYNSHFYNFFYPVNIVSRLKVGFILSSRGCPFSCTFCSPNTRVSYGKRLRLRSVEKVVEEMIALQKEGVNVVYFLDDSFGLKKTWLKELCKEIIRRGVRVKWVAQMRIDKIDKKILKLMKLAGCSTLCLGIESGSDRCLKIIKKGVTIRDIRKKVKSIRKAGIWVVGFFIFGMPSERIKEIIKTIEFAKELSPELIQVHVFSPFPSSITLVEKKIIWGSKFHPTTSISSLPIEKLNQLQKYFYKKFYFSPTFIINLLTKQFLFYMFNIDSRIKLLKDTIKFLLIKSTL